jgi:hypothetical protein
VQTVQLHLDFIHQIPPPKAESHGQHLGATGQRQNSSEEKSLLKRRAGCSEALAQQGLAEGRSVDSCLGRAVGWRAGEERLPLHWVHSRTPWLPSKYLNERFHTAVKEFMAIHWKRPRSPHFLWLRGKTGGPRGKWNKRNQESNQHKHTLGKTLLKPITWGEHKMQMGAPSPPTHWFPMFHLKVLGDLNFTHNAKQEQLSYNTNAL